MAQAVNQPGLRVVAWEAVAGGDGYCGYDFDDYDDYGGDDAEEDEEDVGLVPGLVIVPELKSDKTFLNWVEI